MISRKTLAVLMGVIALALPAAASAFTPYNYFDGGVYPGAPNPAASDGNHARQFNNLFFTSGDWYNGSLLFVTTLCGDRGGNSQTTPYLIDSPCPLTASTVSCQRNPSYNPPYSGGTGYRSSFYCRTTN